MFVKLTSGFSMVALLSRNLVLQDCWETGSKSYKLEVTFAIHLGNKEHKYPLSDDRGLL